MQQNKLFLIHYLLKSQVNLRAKRNLEVETIVCFAKWKCMLFVGDKKNLSQKYGKKNKKFGERSN